METHFAKKDFEKAFELSTNLNSQSEAYYHLYSSHHLNKFNETFAKVNARFKPLPVKLVTISF